VFTGAFIALLSPLDPLSDTKENVCPGLLYIGPYCTLYNLERKFKCKYRVFRANVCVLSLLKKPDDLLGNEKTIGDEETSHNNLCFFHSIILAVLIQVSDSQTPNLLVPGHSAPTLRNIPCPYALLMIMHS